VAKTKAKKLPKSFGELLTRGDLAALQAVFESCDRARQLSYHRGMDFQVARPAGSPDEVTERVWPANEVMQVHSHPFAVYARVTAGEMWRNPFAALDAAALPLAPPP
jgi:hypothetical protein